MPTYTGRREIFETKYSFYENFTQSDLVDEGQVTKIIDDVPVLGDFLQNKLETRDFSDVFNVKTQPDYTGNRIIDNSIDNDLCKLVFKKEQPITDLYPYKFVKKIELVIDSITLNTYAFQIEDDQDETRDDAAYKQIQTLLPFTVNINNKEIAFNSSNIHPYQTPEYGYFGPTEEYTDTDELDPPRIYNGLTLTQDYNKTFELSSFPEALSVTLDFNNNLMSDSYKTETYRDNPSVDTEGTARYINRALYYHSFIANFRIDCRIVQTIDYESQDNRLLNSPQLVEKEPLTLQTLSKLLERRDIRQNDLKLKRDAKKKKKLVFKFLKEEDIENITKQIEEKQVTPQNYKEEVIKNIPDA